MGPQLSRPGSVTGAAILWIIYGSLGALGGMASLGASGGRVGAPSFVGLGIAIAFLVSGIQALTGRARGVLASGITSIIWGLLVLIAFVALSSIVREFRHIGGLLAVIGLVFGGMLITGGILACAGNAKYKAWRASKGL